MPARPARRSHRAVLTAVVTYGALAAGAQLSLDGCTNIVTETPPPTIIGPGTTSMSVDPTTFLGPLLCSAQPGAVQSYVATVTEVLHPCADGTDCRGGVCALGVCVDETTICDDDTVEPNSCSPGICVPRYCSNKPGTACGGLNDLDACECQPTDPASCVNGICLPQYCGETFVLPSSPPTSCAQSAFFEYVDVGASYVAEVDAYKEPAGALVPVCGEVGPSKACQRDDECAPAYGCAGRCRVLKYETVANECLVNTCGAEAECLMQKNCLGLDEAEWASCAQSCGADKGKGWTVESGGNVCAFGGTAVPCCELNGVQQPTCCSLTCLTPHFEIPLTECDATGSALPSTGGVKSCVCNYVATEGDRHMYLKDAGVPVDPDWTTPTPCGEGPMPPTGVSFVNVPITPCPVLVPADGGVVEAGVTTIDIIPSAALPSYLACVGAPVPDGGLPGTVTGFDVVPFDATLSPQTGLPCPSGAGVAYANVNAGGCYGFRLVAHVAASDAGPAATYASLCSATTVAGVTVSAMCDPLVPGDGGTLQTPCP